MNRHPNGEKTAQEGTRKKRTVTINRLFGNALKDIGGFTRGTIGSRQNTQLLSTNKNDSSGCGVVTKALINHVEVQLKNVRSKEVECVHDTVDTSQRSVKDPHAVKRNDDCAVQLLERDTQVRSSDNRVNDINHAERDSIKQYYGHATETLMHNETIQRCIKILTPGSISNNQVLSGSNNDHHISPTSDHKSDSYDRQHLDAITNLLLNTVEEQKGRAPVNKILDDINDAVCESIQTCNVRLYGSYMTDFATSNSDVNLEFYSKSEAYITNRFYNQVRKNLQKALPRYFINVNESINVSKTYITFVEPEFGAMGNLRYLGSHNSAYRNSLLLQAIGEYEPHFRPLVICLRHWAEVCSIHEVEYGRLPLFAFAFLVIYYLQRTSPPVLPVIDIHKEIRDHEFEKKNSDGLGTLWLGLIHFYSSVFNWRDEVISIGREGSVLKDQFSWGKCWIGIEDPFQVKTNIAKSVISQDISHFIQMCFKQSYKYFTLSSQFEDSECSNSTDEGYGSVVTELSFSSLNFIGGIEMPTFCADCEEFGFLCPECSEEKDEELPSLPVMTTAHLNNINKALLEAYEFHGISEETKNYRIKLVQEIEEYVAKRYSCAKLYLMGSTLSGFGFKNSDLDICMTFADRKMRSDAQPKTIIRNLCFHLRKNPDFSSVIAIYSAKVPLVQFYCPKENLRGDISLYNLLAVENTKLLQCYSMIDDRARILGCAMKLLAKNACIADTAQKSLSSYSYTLMVIHFLQRTNPPVLPYLQDIYDGTKRPRKTVEDCDVWFYSDLQRLSNKWKAGQNCRSVAELWLELLEYYTGNFDLSSIITVREKENRSLRIRSSRLYNIEDPFIVSKNLGSVMSAEMSTKTWRTMLRAKKLFNSPIDHVPSGFQDLKEYFFHPMSLTDGQVMKTIECNLCGKLGHKQEQCGRSLRIRGRGRARRS